MVRRFMMALALVAGVAACAGDAPEEVAPPAPGEPVVITGVDYAYQGVPESVPAGTTLAFTNGAEGEAHELTVYRIDDEETRPLAELVRLPDAESRDLISFVGVSIALPSEDGEVFEGDLTLAEASRYALVCLVPTGVDPQAYVDYARAPGEADPPLGGPLHVAVGMFSELTVE